MEMLDEVPARRVGEDVVDAGGPISGGVAVPVLTGGVGGGVLVGSTLGDVVPAFLQELQEGWVAPDVGVGVHAEEVRGSSHPRGGPGRLLEESGAVSPSEAVEGSNVYAVGGASASTCRGTGGERKRAEDFFPSRGVTQVGHNRVVSRGADDGLGG